MTTSTDTPSVANVLAVFDNASPSALAYGMNWYSQANHEAAYLTYVGRDLSIRQTSAILAALSPMNGWKNNRRKAEQLIRQDNGAGCGLGKNVEKAVAILHYGDIDSILGGDKVRAFYESILFPHADWIRPVIDRHAFDIAVGERTDEKRRGILSHKGVYDAFADVYREAARLRGIGAAEMQATTWEFWRECLGITA